MPDPTAQKYAFISHASEDREKAEEVCQSLERNGFDCWIAPRDVRAGHDYPEEIVHGIAHSRCFIILISESANTSSFVKRELECAVQRGKPVFPVRLEDVLPSAGLELYVSSSHWIDAWSGSLSDHCLQLTNNLRDEKVIKAVTPSPKRLPKWALSAISIILIVLVVTGVNALTRGGKSSSSSDSNAPGSHTEMIEDHVAASGVDLSSITKEDIQLRLEVAGRGRDYTWHVDMSSEVYKLLQPMALAKFHLGDTPEERFGLIDHPQIGDITHIKSKELRKFKDITIRFEARILPGAAKVPAIGPFTYEFDADQLILGAHKRFIEDQEEWIKYLPGRKGGLWNHHLAEVIVETLSKIHMGTDPKNLDRIVTVSKTGEMTGPIPAPSLSWNHEHHLPFARNTSFVSIQFEYTDGSKSSVKTYHAPKIRE